MSERRFYVKNDNLLDASVILTGDEFRHIFKVLRLKTSDNIVLFNGDGYDYHGTILSVTASSATVKVTKKEENPAEPHCHVTLFQALPKGEKADFIVQKATELGLKEVIFFDSEFTVKKQNDNKNERFVRIAAEAAKQCGRSSVPQIDSCQNLKSVAKKLENFDLKLLANEREREQSLKGYLPQIEKCGRIALIIGSEGGFSEEEVKTFMENGAKSISLGERILRTETAAVAVASIVMCAAGELGK